MSDDSEVPRLELPKIKARLFRKDLLLARNLLSRMWYVTRITGKPLYPSPPLAHDYFDDPSAPIPDLVWAARIEELWKRLFIPKGQRLRVRLDFLDVSLCQLAVRGLKKQVKHKHLDPPRPDYIPASVSFLRRLEKLRRRAKTAALHTIGKERYKWIAAEWLRYEDRLKKCCINVTFRHTLASRRGMGPIRPSESRRAHRFYIDEIIKIAERELQVDELLIPERSILKKWAQTLLRSVQRGREGVGSNRLVTTPFGATTIRFYMRNKVHRYVRDREQQ